MAHGNQQDFCLMVKKLYPEYFTGKTVLDVGSLDVSFPPFPPGNNKILFTDCDYIGLDIGEGKNVDVVCAIEDYAPQKRFDVVISTEMLEHAVNWQSALERMYELLKSGGLFLLTCAGEGRSEHGTTENAAWASPHTNNYYCNVSDRMFSAVIDPNLFDVYYLKNDKQNFDLQFYGIKK